MPYKSKIDKAAHNKKYAAAHREKAKETSRLWRKANPERHRANAKSWQERNPEHAQSIRHRRRQRVRQIKDPVLRTITAAYRKAIANDCCVYCGGPGEVVDHFFPLSKGGQEVWYNLVRACAFCNRRKYNKCGTYVLLRFRSATAGPK